MAKTKSFDCTRIHETKDGIIGVRCEDLGSKSRKKVRIELNDSEKIRRSLKRG